MNLKETFIPLEKDLQERASNFMKILKVSENILARLMRKTRKCLHQM